MADYFKQIQVDLERMGFEYVMTNSKNGQTWKHPLRSVVIYPGMKEHTHRNLLRDIRKALGVHTETNKRKVAQIKERQAKQREVDRREAEIRLAWLDARIRELELANSMRQLTAKQRDLLNERLREREELRRLMSDTPGWA